NVHKWMRIRHTPSLIFFETSTNGSTNWITQYSVNTSTVTWSMTAVTIGLTTQRENANASTGYSSFARFNLAPATSSGSFFQCVTPITVGAAAPPTPPPPPPSGTGIPI